MSLGISTHVLSKRRVVVGFSGGVTSAWCLGWALREFPRHEVVALFHNTQEEDPDTYRFLREVSTALGNPITDRSDGRSVTELFYDENMLTNDRSAFCSRILKIEQACTDWVTCELKVQPPKMYTWSDHANCVGCVRGGKAYWLAVRENRPDVFAQRTALEEEFGHSFMSQGFLRDDN